MTTVRDVTSPLSRPTEFVVDSGEFVVVCPQDSRSLSVKLCLDNNDGGLQQPEPRELSDRSRRGRLERRTDGCSRRMLRGERWRADAMNCCMDGWMDDSMSIRCADGCPGAGEGEACPSWWWWWVARRLTGWIGAEPLGRRRSARLVPESHELSSSRLVSRLAPPSVARVRGSGAARPAHERAPEVRPEDYQRRARAGRSRTRVIAISSYRGRRLDLSLGADGPGRPGALELLSCCCYCRPAT